MTRSKKPSPHNGVLNINKPTGMTSRDAVDEVCRIAGTRQVGHTGTLDPMATGVLPICVGKATRIARFLLSTDKEYLVEMLLGKTTDTQDTTGRVIEERPVPPLDKEELDRTLEGFRGAIDQIPPMVSAKKHKGKRLYQLARAGVEVEREPCRITVYELEMEKIEPPVVRIRLVCSKGTYVRTLCHDIGQALGCGAAMCGLVRSRCGNFRIEDSVDLETLSNDGIRKEYMHSIDDALSCYPALRVGDREECRLRRGQAISAVGVVDRSAPFAAGSLVRHAEAGSGT